ncbi:MAG: type II toxin-antitoxin system RelE/ParE family toxin [Patescibacteria group bacterium]
MDAKYKVEIFPRCTEFLEAIDNPDSSKMSSNISAMAAGDFVSVSTRKLRGKIRELKYKEYRLIFFIHKDIINFTNGFVKKTNKTPKREIDYAEKIYKHVTNS